jgi:hypothetical protein
VASAAPPGIGWPTSTPSSPRATPCASCPAAASDIDAAAPRGPAVPGLPPELEDEVADRLASQI